jgi:alkylation response protein AidB-like acyl-CoA dehydrogenase
MTLLGIDDEYRQLRGVVWDVLGECSSGAVLHRIVEAGDGANAAADKAFAELGVFGMDVPEDYAGGGGTIGHLRQVFEGCGWAAASARVIGTSACVGALLRSDADAARRTWLPRFASGGAGGAVALPGVFAAGSAKDDDVAAATAAADEADDTGAADADGLTATPHGGGWRLDGQASYVLDAMTAAVFVVLARTLDGAPLLGLVESGTRGLDVERRQPVDRTRNLGRLTLAQVELPAANVIAVDDAAARGVEAITNRTSLAMAADSLGIAARVLDMTARYARERKQFDRAIGSFQAVKHQLADMLVRTELTRALVDEATVALLQERPDASLLTSMAKDDACVAAAWIAGRGVQLHGGIGYTWEHEMHIYLKRALLNEALFGDRRWHRDRIVTRLGANGRGGRGR